MGWGGLVALIFGVFVALAAAACVAQRINEVRDSRRFPPPGQLVDVGNGRGIHLFCKGAPIGPTVVIEQGLASPSILWWPVQDAIAKFAHVCTYDRAGYQWSDAGGAAHSVHESVADLRAVLSNAAVPKPYVLVGHSFGGLLVRLYARMYAEDVAAVVLVDSPDESVVQRDSFPGYNRTLGRMFALMRAAANLGLMRWAMRSQARQLGLPAGLKGVLAAQAGTARFYRTAVANSHALAQFASELRRGSALGSLGDLPLSVITHGVPFLGPAAVLEQGWSEGQRHLAALSTDSELIVAAKSNHMINNDEPEVVVAAVRRVHAAALQRILAAQGAQATVNETAPTNVAPP